MRSTAAPYTESRLTRSVANERVGFPVVEHNVYSAQTSRRYQNRKFTAPSQFEIVGAALTSPCCIHVSADYYDCNA